MVAKGKTAKHSDQSLERVRRLIAVMFGAKPDDIDGKTMSRPKQTEARLAIAHLVAKARLVDLTTERVQDAIATFRDSGRSLQTCNHYRACVRAFGRWAWKHGHLRDNPLLNLEGFNAKEDRRHDRRTVSLDELKRLIMVAEQGPVYQEMTGPMRALCYRLAVATGLRYGEIASILPESFDWKAPSLTVAAAYTKNGQTATLPLPSDLAADLAAYVALLEPKVPIFPLPAKGVDMLKPDLEAAGIAYVDASGLFFDFHSLRCQTATLADAAGVSPRVVQRLMRHSTLELTGRYTRPRAVDIEAAASRLPSLKSERDKREATALAATGTDGHLSHRLASEGTGSPSDDAGKERVKGQRISDALSHYFPTGGAGTGQGLPEAGGMIGSTVERSVDQNSLEMSGQDASGRDLPEAGGITPERIRTSNLRFRRPMLYPIELRVRRASLFVERMILTNRNRGGKAAKRGCFAAMLLPCGMLRHERRLPGSNRPAWPVTRTPEQE
jgi:integrase